MFSNLDNDSSHEAILRKLEEINAEQHSGAKERAIILQRVNSVEQRVIDVEESINEINQTLRGAGESGGIIAEIAVMRQFFDSSYSHIRPVNVPTSKEEKEKTFISWSWIVEKIMTPVLIAFIMWLLFTAVPHIVGGQ